MIVREILEEEKESFNQLVLHPLQSWEWGEFRKKTGIKIVRLGTFKGRKLTSGYQVSIHPIPHTPYTIIYFPKGPKPDQEMLASLAKLGRQEKAIFVKLEPQVEELEGQETHESLLNYGCQAGKPLFTKYTFQIDLTKYEEELMLQMKEKTRYNVRLAQRNDVTVKEDNSLEAFETYLKLTRETTQRQKFYAHSEGYHRLMWETLRPASQGSGQALTTHLLTATYQKKILVAWILFVFNKVLYYPYGASSTEHRDVMASNLIMWEAMKFGKKMGCQTFDLWGALGPNPDPKDPWYGFHRFKEGYGGKLVEFIGTYDLVVNPALYTLYNLTDKIRWLFLRTKSRLTLTL